ncbi:cytochrome b/b6 domain-containing protein [Reinekea sp.]|jgi:thiosulfate reductase cytochrome b subunit|uniref:cytochrome b/b6 domain-containing protein n=1 Tax=Reinekea sp. TaxID=1970455 RepID=UPI003989EDCF
MTVKTERIYIFKGFERFWHWMQSLLIFIMAITGFEIHGTYQLLGFERAITVHEFSAWSLIVLWVFAIFWHLSTGEYKHYLPVKEGMWKQVMYYTRGIFTGEPHPFHASLRAKHNPLQRVAYLSLKVFMFPLIWISGLLYLFYNDWAVLGLEKLGLTLEMVAVVHVIGAFLILLFIIAHLYLITTGETVLQFTKAMITGWEEVPVETHAKEAKPSENSGERSAKE